MGISLNIWKCIWCWEKMYHHHSSTIGTKCGRGEVKLSAGFIKNGIFSSSKLKISHVLTFTLPLASFFFLVNSARRTLKLLLTLAKSKGLQRERRESNSRILPSSEFLGLFPYSCYDHKEPAHVVFWSKAWTPIWRSTSPSSWQHFYSRPERLMIWV
jgi:hypothetical protein